ncbi:hypothetical protein [Streptomyces longispororuber]|uniref:hypothetical protein n=1 Tax=Streptomyces longispororuber TaxID=68230 RepID=UPI001E5DA426|nr:hypothetical protein [Streptomyces longispororuber]
MRPSFRPVAVRPDLGATHAKERETTTQYGNQLVGRHHAPARNGAGENVLSIIVIVLSTIGLLFLPIVFELGGPILALIAMFASTNRSPPSPW